MDALADVLSSLELASPTVSLTHPPQSRNGLICVRGGREVPQSSLIKIKTRVDHLAENFPRAAQYLQLMFGQTPVLHLGIHRDGTFYDIRECQLDALESTYAAKVQPGLQKLRRVLEEIRNIAVERGKGVQLSLVYRKEVSPDLQVMERSRGKSLLPDDVLQRFSA